MHSIILAWGLFFLVAAAMADEGDFDFKSIAARKAVRDYKATLAKEAQPQQKAMEEVIGILIDDWNRFHVAEIEERYDWTVLKSWKPRQRRAADRYRADSLIVRGRALAGRHGGRLVIRIPSAGQSRRLTVQSYATSDLSPVLQLNSVYAETFNRKVSIVIDGSTDP